MAYNKKDSLKEKAAIIRKENIYNLKVKNIKNLIVNREKVNEDYFWRNNAVNGWCISGRTGNNKDLQYCTYDDYWLCVYDTGKIKVKFSSMELMSYNFNAFGYLPSIENHMDADIQLMFIRKMNELIKDGVFTIPENFK